MTFPEAPPLPDWFPLDPDEQVLFHAVPARAARVGAMLASLGLFEAWRRRHHFLVTDHRVAALRGIVSRERQVIPIAMVADVAVREGTWGATVFVSTVEGSHGTQPFGPMGPRQAAAFAEAIRRARPATPDGLPGA